LRDVGRGFSPGAPAGRDRLRQGYGGPPKLRATAEGPAYDDRMSPLLHVIHEDDDLLVVNKPAGLVCHPTRDGELSSLIGRVRLHLGHAEGRLVNRLDRETSGVVLVAKHAAAASELGKGIAASQMRKRYWAIVHGHVDDAGLDVDAPLGRDEASAVAIKDCVRADGASARTVARVLRRFARGDAAFTWLDVTPHTGRKHQIRIHLAHAGHSIVGDKIYGADERLYLRFIDGTLTPADEAALMLPNHALHARQLSFAWRGREWTFDAPAEDGFLFLDGALGAMDRALGATDGALGP
jgi:23S rRNA pseudouridine1911/1915/1917 synthase